jgi:hypothetical protein
MVNRSVIRRRNKSQFVRRLLKRGGCSGGTTCVVRSTMTEEWSEDRSRLDVAVAEFWGIPFVTQKSIGLAVYSVGGPVGGFARREMA